MVSRTTVRNTKEFKSWSGGNSDLKCTVEPEQARESFTKPAVIEQNLSVAWRWLMEKDRSRGSPLPRSH